MPRIESDVKSTYRPKWGWWEGAREIVSNGKDAETRHKAQLTVSHDGRTLRVKNEGCTVEREALLFGHSTSADHEEFIGQHGDGLKVGCLALVRAGYRVRIFTGAEVWVPAIERSAAFKADVLVWKVATRPYENRVLVEIDCPPAKWLEVKDRFLWLQKSHEKDVKTNFGTLLGDPKHDGHIFVKGVWIFHDNKLENGYNLKTGKVDIDRKMVEDGDLRWQVASILGAASTRLDHADRTLALIQDEAKDADYLRYLHEVPEPLANRAAEKFFTRYGAHAIPVSSIEEAGRLEHLGRRGIVVGQIMQKVLSVRVASYESIINSLDTRISHTYQLHEIAPNELENYTSARKLMIDAGISQTESVALNIVDFRDGTLGLHSLGEVYLNRSILKSRSETLSTMVHEIAHEIGGADGEMSHVRNIENTWSKIVEHLRG